MIFNNMEIELTDIIKEYHRETYSVKRLKVNKGKRFSKAVLYDNVTAQILTKDNKLVVKSEINKQLERIFGIDLVNYNLD
jgi:hypothetical protein